MRLMIAAIDQRAQQTGQISKRDKRKLEILEKWLEKESSGIDGLEEQLKDLRQTLSN
jgi:hypothetical protein